MTHLIFEDKMQALPVVSAVGIQLLGHQRQVSHRLARACAKEREWAERGAEEVKMEIHGKKVCETDEDGLCQIGQQASHFAHAQYPYENSTIIADVPDTSVFLLSFASVGNLCTVPRVCQALKHNVCGGRSCRPKS